jgi:Ser/Thr protein kinase RdoA (MazF antagonist)
MKPPFLILISVATVCCFARCSIFCKQLFHIESDKAEYELDQFKGYQSIRSLTEEEIKLIPEAAAAIWIFYLVYKSK